MDQPEPVWCGMPHLRGGQDDDNDEQTCPSWLMVGLGEGYLSTYMRFLAHNGYISLTPNCGGFMQFDWNGFGRMMPPHLDGTLEEQHWSHFLSLMACKPQEPLILDHPPLPLTAECSNWVLEGIATGWMVAYLQMLLQNDYIELTEKCTMGEFVLRSDWRKPAHLIVAIDGDSWNYFRTQGLDLLMEKVDAMMNSGDEDGDRDAPSAHAVSTPRPVPAMQNRLVPHYVPFTNTPPQIALRFRTAEVAGGAQFEGPKDCDVVRLGWDGFEQIGLYKESIGGQGHDPSVQSFVKTVKEQMSNSKIHSAPMSNVSSASRDEVQNGAPAVDYASAASRMALEE